MKSDWLKGQLTPVKKRAPMWTELADAIQQIFEETVEPSLNRLKGVNSLFTMHDDDLTKKSHEMGWFFEIPANVAQEDRALTLLHRMDEVHLKDTAWPLRNTIDREFQGMEVDWVRLYAPKDFKRFKYGTYFLHEEDIVNGKIPSHPDEPVPGNSTLPIPSSDINDWWLTSRGAIRANLIDVLSKGMTLQQFVARIRELVPRLLPTHIVYEKEILYMQFLMIDEPDLFSIGTFKRTKIYHFHHVDAFSFAKKRRRSFGELKGNYSKKNYFCFDELPLDCFPLDTGLNLNGERYSNMQPLMIDEQALFSIGMLKLSKIYRFHNVDSCSFAIKRSRSFGELKGGYNKKNYFCFDELPLDCFSLDTELNLNGKEHSNEYIKAENGRLTQLPSPDWDGQQAKAPS